MTTLNRSQQPHVSAAWGLSESQAAEANIQAQVQLHSKFLGICKLPSWEVTGLQIS